MTIVRSCTATSSYSTLAIPSSVGWSAAPEPQPLAAVQHDDGLLRVCLACHNAVNRIDLRPFPLAKPSNAGCTTSRRFQRGHSDPRCSRATLAAIARPTPADRTMTLRKMPLAQSEPVVKVVHVTYFPMQNLLNRYRASDATSSRGFADSVVQREAASGNTGRQSLLQAATALRHASADALSAPASISGTTLARDSI